jgi:hypothetical protein
MRLPELLRTTVIIFTYCRSVLSRHSHLTSPTIRQEQRTQWRFVTMTTVQCYPIICHHHHHGCVLCYQLRGSGLLVGDNKKRARPDTVQYFSVLYLQKRTIRIILVKGTKSPTIGADSPVRPVVSLHHIRPCSTGPGTGTRRPDCTSLVQRTKRLVDSPEGKGLTQVTSLSLVVVVVVVVVVIMVVVVGDARDLPLVSKLLVLRAWYCINTIILLPKRHPIFFLARQVPSKVGCVLVCWRIEEQGYSISREGGTHTHAKETS